jgi:hypothetical protein
VYVDDMIEKNQSPTRAADRLYALEVRRQRVAFPRRRATRGMLLGAVVVALAASVAARTVPAGDDRGDGASRAGASCPGARISTADGCVGARQARRRIVELVQRVMGDNDLAAAIVRVDVGNRKLVGLRNTHISDLPAIPPPALHAYSTKRYVYEDSTFWSPSWTIGRGVIMTSNVHDVIKSAKAIGSGRLLSRRAAREQVASYTVGLPGMSATFYYGLGINVAPPWRFQNPVLNGYSGIMAYLPDRRLSIAIVSMTGPRSPGDESFSAVLFRQIAAYLAPEHPLAPNA